MKTPHIIIILAAIEIATMATSRMALAQSELITFDDLSISGIVVPNGYGGLQWNNFGYIAENLAGYASATVSPPNVAFNRLGFPAAFSVSSGAFDLNSAYLAGAWNDRLQVEAQGFSGGVLLYDNTYTVNTTNSILINFSYYGVDHVSFTSFGGTPDPNYSGHGLGVNFAMDNLSLTIVPEPSTIKVAGLTTILVAGRRLTIRRSRRRLAQRVRPALRDG